MNAFRIGDSVGCPYEIPVGEFEGMDIMDIYDELMKCWELQLPIIFLI